MLRPIARALAIAMALASRLAATAAADLPPPPDGADAPRSWTNAQGKSVVGILVGVSDSGDALLKIRDRVHRVPAASLSEADQAFAAAWAEARPYAGKAWPSGYAMAEPIALDPQGAESGFHRFESEHFAFLSREELRAGQAGEIAKSLEALSRALAALPLPLEAPNRRAKVEGRAVCRFLDTDQEYQAFGGLKNTAGIYNPFKREVVIHLGHFFRDTRGNASARRQDYDLIVHEGTHLLLRGWNGLMPPWLQEGIAEYMAAAHGVPGRFEFAKPQLAKAHLAKFLPTLEIDKGNTLELTKIDAFLAADFEAWDDDTKTGRNDVYRKYAEALLLTYYFIHGDAPGEGRLGRFLAELPTGRGAAEPATEAHLIRGRPIRALEKEVADFWAKNGLKVEFSLDGLSPKPIRVPGSIAP